MKRVVQKSLSEDSSLELLVNSFTDSVDCLSTTYSTNPNSSMERSMIHKLNTTPPKNIFLSNLTKNLSLTNSPVKLNDPKQYLANMETVFALSMILKHFHLFSNAYPIGAQLPQKINGKF